MNSITSIAKGKIPDQLKVSIVAFSLCVITVGFYGAIQNQTVYAQCSNQAECKEELEKIDEEIKKLETNIESETNNQRTLSGEINLLSSEINKTSTEINAKAKLITNIKSEIQRKENSLAALNDRLAREKETLQSIIRKRNELDDATVFEVMLSSENISDFYEDAPSFGFVQESLSDSFAIIDDLKVSIYHQKSSLEQKREEENNVKYSLELEKNKIEVQKQDRDQALTLSEQKEADLAALKKAREEEASAN